MTSMVEDLLLLARSDSGAVELEHIPVELGDVAADGGFARWASPRPTVASTSWSIRSR